MRPVLLASLAAATVFAAPGRSPATPLPVDGAMSVVSANLRFAKPGKDGVPRGSLRIVGDYVASGEGFAPPGDGICLVLGPCGILRRGDFATSVTGRRDRHGNWTLLAKRPWGKGSVVRVRFNPSTGEFHAEARNLDLTPFEGSPPRAQDLVFVVGDETHRGTIPFKGSPRGDAWTYEFVPTLYDPPVNPREDPAPEPDPVPVPDPTDWTLIDLVDPPGG